MLVVEDLTLDCCSWISLDLILYPLSKLVFFVIFGFRRIKIFAVRVIRFLLLSPLIPHLEFLGPEFLLLLVELFILWPTRLVDLLLNFVENVSHPELFGVVHDLVQYLPTTGGRLGLGPVQFQIFVVCLIFLEFHLR